ncbi:alpha/beta fold hydrolase [Candidatus Saccharibacteria bacterium]|nr:alpha/beta fold hydrolase [Candidatus Saccharibacteria bacterium]MBP7834599.1 alpha/beta fold hydrolase [Candidatus Saccharibacteria bacterium]
MRINIFKNIFDRLFNRPKLLNIRYKTGRGKPVILLHGIASNSSIWDETITYIDTNKYQVIAMDLLGFGDSPKPSKNDYSLEEQAKQVAYTVKKNKIKKPVLVVGHSLGALVALEIASNKILKASKLILCSPPIYLPGDYGSISSEYKKTDRAKSNVYFALYETIANKPKVSLNTAKRVANKFSGFILTPETWLPFKQSLLNAINNQNSLNQLKNIKTKTTIIFGKLDLFVIPKYYKESAKNNKNISVESFTGSHNISTKFSKIIAKNINQTK